MMKVIIIPPQIAIGTLKRGAVLKTNSDKFNTPDPHFFLLLNENPNTDLVLFSVCATSQVSAVTRRRRKLKPQLTLVTVPKGTCKFLPLDTVFDCNEVHEFKREELMEKFSNGELKLVCNNITDECKDKNIFKNIFVGIFESPLPKRNVKKFLKIRQYLKK